MSGKGKRMTVMQALALLLLAICAMPPAVALGSDKEGALPDLSLAPRALASNGAIVAMPAIDGLSCRGMADLLDRIDESGYRDFRPVPERHPDREIFEYEHRLAAAYYHRCVMSGHLLEDPAPAFGRGFEPR